MKAVKTKVQDDMPTPVYGAADETGDYLADVQRKMKLNIIRNTPEELVFDMIGVDAPLANALRRILIAEVPTMAIERVYVSENTSVIQDEVLSHRLGLIPLKADPREFEMMTADDESNSMNTLVFKLQVVAGENKADPDGFTSVYSSQLEWQPVGSQADTFEHDPIRPVHDDILIARLKPGQVISLEAHATKGIGKEHAKWSPVGTASYRLLPELVVGEEVEGATAHELVEKCPMGVFDIEDIGRDVAVPVRPRDCTMCRECVRGTAGNGKPWKDLVTIHRIMNHFIFSIESTGCLPAAELFSEAVKILNEKCIETQGALAETLEVDAE